MTTPSRGPGRPIGVGVLGAGLAFQSIHARVLEELAPAFRIVAIWDPDTARAEEAARWLGMRVETSFEKVIADPLIDVIVVASPARCHAEQAIAAFRAGKKAVLVEKPLCTCPQEAREISAAARSAGAALLVGAMHLFDPAWKAAEKALAAFDFEPDLVRSDIVLPPNAPFERWATEPVPAPSNTQPREFTAELLMRLGVLELGIHDLPLVRRLLSAGAVPEVVDARLKSPFGYAVIARAGDAVLDLSATIHENCFVDWRLSATGQGGHMQLDFTPSFVSAGSGAMSCVTRDGSIVHSPSLHNGYAELWLEIGRIVGGTQSVGDPEELAADFCFAHNIAEQACELLRGRSDNG